MAHTRGYCISKCFLNIRKTALYPHAEHYGRVGGILPPAFHDNLHCISVEGNVDLLKNGLKLTDEKGNEFIIKSIGMPHYHNPEDCKMHAELILNGDIVNIGVTLSVC